MKDCKIRTGYRVIGNNTSDGSLHCWYMPTLKEANEFAAHLCQQTGKEVDVCKYIGSHRIVIPTEFVEATDLDKVV